MKYIALEKAKKYAKDVINCTIPAPKYVKLQCKEFWEIANDKSEKFMIQEENVRIIDGLTQLMIMPKGLRAGETIHAVLAPFQWFLIVGALCVVWRKFPEKRKAETVILEIARKNAKTFIIGVFFIILFFLEPKFSKFYSVAPDGKLSREVQEAIREIIRSSPALNSESPRHFKLMRDKIVCLTTDNEYIPLNYSNDKLDGKLPSVFLADEVGALPTSYAIEAMRSGQLTIKNKLGCIISTKYPKFDNPFDKEVEYAKKVLDGIEEDDTLFSLLYEPDNTTNWATDDTVLQHANPLALEVPEIWEDLLKKRKRAIAMESARENFLCKHCNIVYQGTGAESFVSIEALRRGRVEKIDWEGRNVFLGIDLAMTTDNCAFAIVSDDGNGGVLAAAWGFIPEGRVEEKSKIERFDYYRSIEDGECYACGDRIVDYGFIEEVIMNVEKDLGVKVVGFGFDRYNALSTAQKLEAHGWTGTIVEQHSRTLHAPTKWLSELIEQGKFHYTHNRLLENNFANAKCTYDTNLNRYINKKKSSGKVDVVFAILDALYLLQQSKLNRMDWVVQM